MYKYLRFMFLSLFILKMNTIKKIKFINVNNLLMYSVKTLSIVFCFNAYSLPLIKNLNYEFSNCY